MYTSLVIFQICCVILAFYCVFKLLKLHNSVNSKYLLVTLICAVVYGVGYLMEMLSTNLESAMFTFGTQYMGLSFVVLAYFLFTLDYCQFKIKSILKFVLLAYDIVIFLCVLTYKYQGFYYKTFAFDEGGLYPHVVTTKTVLYWSFVVYEVILLFCCSGMFIKRGRKTKQARQKLLMAILFLESLFPIAGTLFNVMGFIPGYDCGPSVVCIMTSLLYLTLTNGKLVDIRGIAYTNLYQNLASGIIITDSDFNYLDSNLMVATMFPEIQGWQVGTPLNTLLVPLINSIDEQYFERDGHYYVSICNRLYEHGDNIGNVITISDISDMRERVEEMRVLKEEADAANEAKSTFLANMSHEIRTPLNAILGMAELSEKESSQEVIADYIGQIKAAGNILLDIVSEVLDISKAESGKLELVSVEYDLLELVEGVINVINMRIGDKPVDFMVDIDPMLPRRLYGDDVRIRQIFLNILGNAVKYTDSGYIKLIIDGEYDEKNFTLKAVVEDSGRGIKDEDKEKLFKPFSQVDVKKNRGITGTGLGLNIASRLVELMDGTIGVESTYGVGSTFFFTFVQDMAATIPIAPGALRDCIKVQKLATFHLYAGNFGNPEGEEEKKEVQYASYPDAAVLVVDDNRVNVKVLCAFLKHFDIAADSCLSGREALNMIKKRKYDLIFMDHMMPDMDGIETTREMLTTCKEYIEGTKILACTANVVKGMEEEFLTAGMNGLLAKPIQMDTLSVKLKQYL